MALDWKKTSKWWYGRFTVNGRSKLVNLGIKIAGTRPDHINATGPGVDGRYIQSRGMAQEKHDRIRDEIHERNNLQEIQQKLIELKTGERMESVLLKDLVKAWERIPRRRELSTSHRNNCRATLLRFVTFIRAGWRGIDDLASITREHAAAFMEAEQARGLSPKSWNDVLKLLRSAFKHCQPEADAYRRYFLTTPAREKETVFRKPFTPAEIKAILSAAKNDDFIRPLIVTAVCTAMRRSDVCLLKWKDVDLEDGFITVKTSKTGQTVTIPIFPLLFDELKKRTCASDGYVFQDQAAMYLKNKSGITWRMKLVLAKAFIDESGETERLPELSQEATRQKGNAYIESLAGTLKAKRMREVFNSYMGGVSGREILAASGISKGTLSGYLNEIEFNIKCRVIRGRHGGVGHSLSALLKAGGAGLRSEQTKGRRRASVRDFHSFRVTWVTLALTGGVPIELVRKVTGHRTVEVVLTHYFQPGREDFRHALQSAMPLLLMNGAKSRDEQLLEIFRGMTAKSLKKDKVRVLAILNGAT